MKSLRIIVAFSILVSMGGCVSRPAFEHLFTRLQSAWKPSPVLDVRDVGRILGNQSHVEQVTAYEHEGTKAYQVSFRDVGLDPAVGKTGSLGYMYEEYQSAEAARFFLDATLKANHLSPDDAIRTQGGAELHYFTGGDVIRMVMIRKENRLVRLKVNPVTSRYSLAEFQRIAAKLAERL